MDMEQRIRVAVRIRPPLERERYDTTCSRKLDDGCSIAMTNVEDQTANTFGFDFCFDASDDQRGVYEESVQEMIDAGLQGSNATIFTYGQTGSGKTYTILGKMSESGSLSAESGLFLRVFGDLFEYRRRAASRTLVLVALSAVELYIEEVMDLLSNKAKIRLRESGDDTLLTGLNRVEVQDMREVMQQFRIANSFRSVASTKMNDASSRSHALFFVDIFQIDVKHVDDVKAAASGKLLSSSLSNQPLTISMLVDEFGQPKSSVASMVKKSRIALVDLAGSERVKRSGVEGQAMVEAQAINKSLSTLGTVINAMYFQSNHVPFRESKLTKVLKTSFVDKSSRLLLIGQIAPASESLSESLGTLRFCDRVKNLKVANATPFVDPEEESRYLAALKSSEAICADLRIAQNAHYYSLQRPRLHARFSGSTVENVIANAIPTLKTAAPERERTIEEMHLKQARREANHDRDEEVQKYRLKFERLQKEVQDLTSLVGTEKGNSKTHKEELEALVEAKMTEAKKMKKSRLKDEEKLTKLRDNVHSLEAELSTLKREMSEALSPGKKFFPAPTMDATPLGKPKKRSNTTATNEVGRHGFDDDDDDASGAHPSTSGGSARKKKTNIEAGANSFDAPSDEETEAPQQQSGGRSPVAQQPPAVALTSPTGGGDSMSPNEEWRKFEQDWQQAEANHEVVSEFYFHVKSINPLHMDYCATLRQNWVIWGEVNKYRVRNSEVLQSSSLIPDIIAFITERAVLISEQVIQASDTFAWFDIDGMSKRLKSPFEMVPPLLSDTVRDPIPLGSVETHTATYLDETEDEHDHHDNDASMVLHNRQQLGLDVTHTHAGSSNMQGGGPNSTTTKDARERRRRMKGNGATKKYDTEEADRQYLMTVYDSTTLVHDVTKYLKAGTVMLKHGRSGKPHNRLFWVTIASFRMELVWIDPENRVGERSSICLGDVGYVSLGSFGKVFRRYPYPNTDPNFFLCFSVGLKGGDRTVNIVAGTLPDFEAWVLGLCHLARIDPHWGRPLDISAFPEVSALNPQEKALCEQNYIFPADYVQIKEKVTNLRDEVQMHLRLFGNDHEQAFASLGGIHLPQLNDRGAVLMTKGELRYHCSPFHLDIFRVCRIWVLFHDMGLLYDPAFTPPTNFGVVTR